MLTLHLVRHGQTNFNAERRVQGQFDSVLTELGEQQAAAMQSVVSDLNLTAVYSSSNVRARRTAEIMVANQPSEISIRDDLREIYMGPWQCRLWTEVAQENPEQVRHFMTEPDRFSFEGCETFEDLQSRGVSAVEEIIQSELEGRVLIVSHGAILKTILAYYSNVPIRDMWAEPSLENCSHSIMEIDRQGQRSVRQISGEDVAGTFWDASTNQNGSAGRRK